MALLRKILYKKPPDGLLGIAERVYVFDRCFSTNIFGRDEFEVYIRKIVVQIQKHFPDASFMAFNFHQEQSESQFTSLLSEYDITVMDYPRHYESCPLLKMELIHHFLSSCETWLSLGQQNFLLMHCDQSGWPILAFMVAALLMYLKQYKGEQRTLEMVYKQAPHELLQLLSPLNPVPSQLRYLQYVSRSIASEWPPLDRALTLDCIILRSIPKFDNDGGCRPIFRIYGQDPLFLSDQTTKVLYSTPKTSKAVRHYRQADSELVKFDIYCHVQGDVVLDCINVDEDLGQEEMIFRIMFNTAFIRSNILMLNRDQIDILWNAEDRFPKDFRAEVLLSELVAAAPLTSEDLANIEDKECLPPEALSCMVKEIFSQLDWLDGKGEVPDHLLHQIASLLLSQEDDLSRDILRLESTVLLPIHDNVSKQQEYKEGDKPDACETFSHEENSVHPILTATETGLCEPIPPTISQPGESPFSSFSGSFDQNITRDIPSFPASTTPLTSLSSSFVQSTPSSILQDSVASSLQALLSPAQAPPTTQSTLPPFPSLSPPLSPLPLLLSLMLPTPSESTSESLISKTSLPPSPPPLLSPSALPSERLIYKSQSPSTPSAPTPLSLIPVRSFAILPQPQPPLPSAFPPSPSEESSALRPDLSVYRPPPTSTPPKQLPRLGVESSPSSLPLSSSPSVFTPTVPSASSTLDIISAGMQKTILLPLSQAQYVAVAELENHATSTNSLLSCSETLLSYVSSSPFEGTTASSQHQEPDVASFKPLSTPPYPPPPAPPCPPSCPLLNSNSSSTALLSFVSSRPSEGTTASFLHQQPDVTSFKKLSIPSPPLCPLLPATKLVPPCFATLEMTTGAKSIPLPPPPPPATQSIPSSHLSHKMATCSKSIPPPPSSPPATRLDKCPTVLSLDIASCVKNSPPPLFTQLVPCSALLPLEIGLGVKGIPPPPPLPPATQIVPSPDLSPMKIALGVKNIPSSPPPPPATQLVLCAPPMNKGTVVKSIPPLSPAPKNSELEHPMNIPSPLPPPPHLTSKNSSASSPSFLPAPPAPPPPMSSSPHSMQSSPSGVPNALGAGGHSVPPPPPGSGLSSESSGIKGRNLTRNKSSKNLNAAHSLSRKPSLKPLHWVKVTRAMQGTLWAETQRADEALKTPEIDMSELESLFSAVAPKPDASSKDKSRRQASLGGKPEKVHLIDLRRANNCEIMLTKVTMPLPDLMSSLLAMDDSVLDIDQVENLIKFCPTKEEMELLQGYAGNKENLGKCEQFFLELMKVPRVESKLRVFYFKIQFHTQVTDLRKSLHVIKSAANEIRLSLKLKRVMQTILSLGNALNQGTARGSAVGFKLDSLLKLTDLRARNNKMTLMHYLCKVLADKLPEVLDFNKDLSNLEFASKMQLKILAEEMQAISKGLEKVDQELTLSENDGPVSETFRKTLKEFLLAAEAEVRSLTALYSAVGTSADGLVRYYGEDPARCPFEQVISTLLNFMKMFERAHEENLKQLELDRKKALKEVENEEKMSSFNKKQSENSSPVKSGCLQK